MFEFLDDFIGALRTSFNAASDVKVGIKNFVKNKKNIREHAKNNIAYFPLIISNSVSDVSIELMMKAFEREYASFMKVLLTQKEVQVADPNSPENNMLRRLGINESEILKLEHELKAAVLREQQEKLLFKQMLKEWDDAKDISKPINEEYNMDLLNEKSMQLSRVLNELVDTGGGANNGSINNVDITNNTYNAAPVGGGGGGAHQTNINMGGQQGGQSGGRGSQNALHGYEPGAGPLSIRTGKITDMDERYRKYSDIQPSLFQIDLTYTVPDGQVFESTTIFGVKVEPHFVPPEEIFANMSNAVSNKNVLFKFVKWTTGEIKFWKDFVFAINTIKQDIYYAKTSSARKVWTDVFKGNHFVNLMRKVMKYNALIPTTSLLVSMDDYYNLKENYGLDIKNVVVAKNLIKSMYVFNICIVDENVKKIYLYKSEDEKYISYTFSYLEKISDQDSNLLKQVLSM